MATPESTSVPEVVPGQVVGGKWRILSLLGRGGMGAVYEGQNIAIGKKVALKFIDAEYARQPEIANRFQREAEAASMVESAHIVHVFDSGTTEDGVPYIVMELLRGEDLRARIRRFGRLPKEEAVHIMAQMLRGLHRAHEAGIVHRDLKPDNIFLVDRDDDPLFAKIVDFGISKMTRRGGDGGWGTLTRQGVVLGTPVYMSPEQAQALPNLDLRTDLFSAGAILFECLTGNPPHGGDSYEQIIVAICTTDAPDIRTFDPTLPASLAEFVKKSMQRDRTRRFQSAKEMLQALLATGITPSATGLTTNNLSAAVHAPPDPLGPHASFDAPLGTRVSWTSPDKRRSEGSTFAATQVVADEARLSRARVIRKRGVVLLGVTVMVGGFLVTFGLMRQPKPHKAHGWISSTSVQPMPSSTAPAPLTVTEPAVSAVSSAPEPLHPPVDLAGAPPLRALAGPTPAAPSPLVPKNKKSTQPSTTPVSAATSLPPPAASGPPAPKAGVAGGLQIKTNYP